jgi:hypothetical protein
MLVKSVYSYERSLNRGGRLSEYIAELHCALSRLVDRFDTVYTSHTFGRSMLRQNHETLRQVFGLCLRRTNRVYYSALLATVTHHINRLQIFVYHVRFEVFTAVTRKNGVFWVVRPCGSCKNRRFGGTWRLLLQGDKNR